MGTFQYGGPAHAPRHADTQRLDDKVRPQRCISTGAYPSRPSPVNTVTMGRLDLPLPLPPLRSIVRPKGLYKNPKTSSESPQEIGNSAVDIPRRQHYRALQIMINSVISYNQSRDEIWKKYSVWLPLTAEALQDLQWWTSQARQFKLPVPTPIIESDASKLGWGAVCQDSKNGGLWSAQ